MQTFFLLDSIDCRTVDSCEAESSNHAEVIFSSRGWLMCAYDIFTIDDVENEDQLNVLENQSNEQ